MAFDFHTHRLDTPLGEGIVCLPQEVILAYGKMSDSQWKEFFSKRESAESEGIWHPDRQGFYAVGIHPWWTAQENFSLMQYLPGLQRLLQFEEVVQLGECGLDRMRGASLEKQIDVFEAQIALSEMIRKPVTIHCVRAFDVLLAEKKKFNPLQQWTIHGFRGKPALAKQLLDTGFDLSFGKIYNSESFDLTPPERRHKETDSE